MSADDEHKHYCPGCGRYEPCQFAVGQCVIERRLGGLRGEAACPRCLSAALAFAAEHPEAFAGPVVIHDPIAFVLETMAARSGWWVGAHFAEKPYNAYVVTKPLRRVYLKRLREQAGHSIPQAAALVHVKRRAWERWESGVREPPEMAIHLYCLLTDQAYEPPA